MSRRQFSPVRWLYLSAWLIVVSLSVGCGYSAQNLSLDQDQARQACETFLKAWQKGGTSKALEPEIVGTDEAWKAGMKLVSFEVLPDEFNDGTNLHMKVKLTLADDSGKTSETNVTYVVGTSPRVTVFRD